MIINKIFDEPVPHDILPAQKDRCIIISSLIAYSIYYIIIKVKKQDRYIILDIYHIKNLTFIIRYGKI